MSESSLYVMDTMLLRPKEAGTWFDVCELPADDVKTALVRPVLSAADASNQLPFICQPTPR